MSTNRRIMPQFFVTSAQDCPYLPGQRERKLFTHLKGNDVNVLSSHLIQNGFRRSQNIAYKPACETCSACEPTRVLVNSFEWSKSFRRVLKDNQDIVGTTIKPQATTELYELFRRYVDTRHSDGGMASMGVQEFAAMIDDSVVDTRVIEYRFTKTHPRKDELVGAILIDILNDGLSLIYSFFDPGLQERSLGTFVVLDCLLRAKRLTLPHLYLGYFVDGSPKMNYKARFKPQERFSATGWNVNE